MRTSPSKKWKGCTNLDSNKNVLNSFDCMRFKSIRFDCIIVLMYCVLHVLRALRPLLPTILLYIQQMFWKIWLIALRINIFFSPIPEFNSVPSCCRTFLYTLFQLGSIVQFVLVLFSFIYFFFVVCGVCEDLLWFFIFEYNKF